MLQKRKELIKSGINLPLSSSNETVIWICRQVRDCLYRVQWRHIYFIFLGGSPGRFGDENGVFPFPTNQIYSSWTFRRIWLDVSHTNDWTWCNFLVCYFWVFSPQISKVLSQHILEWCKLKCCSQFNMLMKQIYFPAPFNSWMRACAWTSYSDSGLFSWSVGRFGG